MLVVAVAASLVTAGYAADSPPMLNLGQRVALPRLPAVGPLRQGRVWIAGGRPFAQSPAFGYRLPPGARQGHHGWYLLRTHFVLRLNPRSGTGWIYASGLTDGRAGVQDQFRVTRRRGRLHTEWSEVGLVNGNRHGSADGTTIEIRDENFVQDAGVRPGANALRFQLEELGQARASGLQVKPDTAVEASALGPGKLVLSVSARPGPRLSVGSTLTIRAILRNPAPREVRNIVVTVAAPRRLLSPIGAVRATLHSVGRKPMTLSFVLRALDVGHAQVLLNVDSVNSSPSAIIRLKIVRRGA